MTPFNTYPIAPPDAGPIAIAFDNFFSLYVLTATGSHLIRYGDGVVLTSVAPGAIGLAVDPPPVGTGLSGRIGSFAMQLRAQATTSYRQRATGVLGR